jgi:hypothetical protein
MGHAHGDADIVKIIGAGIVVAGAPLGDDEHAADANRFNGALGFLAAEDERRRHMREEDDVSQRQHRHHLPGP